MPELIVHSADGKQALSFEGTPVLYELISHIPDAPSRSCGGSGKCGACAVIAQGALSSEPDSAGKVLSCQTSVLGDAEVWLPARKKMVQIETARWEKPYAFSPLSGSYGAAIDIGTTTIVLELISLREGKTLAVVSCENPQRIIAADVIGRIEGAMQGQLNILKTLVNSCIDELEKEAFAQAGLDGASADWRVIAGNTTMLYLYTGRDPRTLAAAPFEADCLFGIQNAHDILPACAGAFVGADITCALLASQICQSDETSLLIDIGTNGELALWHKGTLTCCATAAGPAFEGCGISCGTGSILGAIDSACVKEDRLSFTTINEAPPCGICGSGLIDLTAALLETEELDETGFLEDDIELSKDVVLTQQDIRQVQLAKGAIAAGIQTLLEIAGLDETDVSTLYIAGGFGSHLNLHSAAKIGLIPASMIGKCVVLGNASLAGARQILLSENGFAQAQRIAQSACCINLASQKRFTDCFVENMLFE